MRDLLFEIGTEELPAGFQRPSLQQLKEKFIQKAAELKIEHGAVVTLGSPRRLTIIVKDLALKQDDILEELLGPSKKAAFDGDGNPTKAAQGFARSKGASVEDLQVVETAKGEYLMLVRELKGQETVALLPKLLEELIGELSFAKSMRWGSYTTTFARPIQWLLALFGEDVVALKHGDIVSAHTSRGHRFMANVDFVVKDAASYEELLLEHNVIVDPAKRRAKVVEEIHRALAESTLVEGTLAVDEELVDTVTNLVEYPYGVCGVFAKSFLDLPDEVLTTSMRVNQKYFTIVDDAGALVNGFVAVNNTKVIDSEVTRKGHQRVLRARLDDAIFFFAGDKKTSLESRVASLAGIVFQTKLGTMAEKTERIVKLTRSLAEVIDHSLVADACRAATLCKADLITDMVGEFTSLQGVMGAAYATNDGEKEGVALAIKEHYMPKRAGAELPDTDLGALVGLADRLDTIAGCFGIGQIPTGTADPFGLRRLTLAVLHIISERGYTISLHEMVGKALALYGDKVNGGNETVEKIIDFMRGRLANDCVSRGQNAGAVEAVLSLGFDDLGDIHARIQALMEVRKEDSFAVLAASFKRIRNIIKNNTAVEVQTDLFEEDAERNLFSLFQLVAAEMQDLVAKKEYLAALMVMLKMKEPVDAFFESVMVMAENDAVRQNRLNLLTALADLVMQIGDISKMQD
ncbi:glycine--tRNA ligase subunit beta [Desulfotalea psychrophila]|uniref:Glycine--tRNA ligase beta subunit n=1 Tax=Desulfotalea psychrophila (strain LSv54 / DSM 12343) TaxID=177439 RepID=Q6AN59_DESPS|nr:glycine--tRNA ligase subunit beta [Desulfotalea psychrophila]CAG36215.1 probable glycyl-tRNA synthetase, beta subunit [Desulfotalea psychrophila LSv54]